MIGKITTNRQREIYNNYVSLLSYTQKSQAVAIAHKQQAQIAYYQILNIVENMSQKQYDSYKGDAVSKKNGVAVIQGDSCWIDDDGNYNSPILQCEFYVSILDMVQDDHMWEQIQKARQDMIEGLRQATAYNVIYELIAERIGVPEYTAFQTPCDIVYDQILVLNDLVTAMENCFSGGGDHQQQKITAIRKLLPPINLDSLQPTQQAMDVVSKQLKDLSVFRNINIQLEERLARSAKEREQNE